MFRKIRGSYRSYLRSSELELDMHLHELACSLCIFTSRHRESIFTSRQHFLHLHESTQRIHLHESAMQYSTRQCSYEASRLGNLCMQFHESWQRLILLDSATVSRLGIGKKSHNPSNQSIWLLTKMCTHSFINCLNINILYYYYFRKKHIQQQ